VVLRADVTRINGTYWNVHGYWRGRLNTTSAPSQPTIQDLLNRTYHMGLTYANPQLNLDGRLRAAVPALGQQPRHD
jgi:hypothetical protein